MDKDDLAAKRITMRDAPIKKVDPPKMSKPMTTHDIFKPVADIPEDPKQPGGPMITTGNVEKIREQAAMRSRMEKARQAKMDKIKEEIEAKEKAKPKEKPAPKAKSEKKPKPAEKKAHESPPEAITEVPEVSDIPKKEVKPDPLKEAVEKASKPTSTRKSYTTKKKTEKKDEDKQ